MQQTQLEVVFTNGKGIKREESGGKDEKGVWLAKRMLRQAEKSLEEMEKTVAKTVNRYNLKDNFKTYQEFMEHQAATHNFEMENLPVLRHFSVPVYESHFGGMEAEVPLNNENTTTF